MNHNKKFQTFCGHPYYDLELGYTTIRKKWKWSNIGTSEKSYKLGNQSVKYKRTSEKVRFRFTKYSYKVYISKICSENL